MKTDTLSFSFVTAIVLAGVIIAIVSPTRPVNLPVDSVAHVTTNSPVELPGVSPVHADAVEVSE